MAFRIADTATLLTASAFCTLHFQMVATQSCPFHCLLLLTVALCALVTALPDVTLSSKKPACQKPRFPGVPLDTTLMLIAFSSQWPKGL